jgi:hypothetical protein
MIEVWLLRAGQLTSIAVFIAIDVFTGCLRYFLNHRDLVTIIAEDVVKTLFILGRNDFLQAMVAFAQLDGIRNISLGYIVAACH